MNTSFQILAPKSFNKNTFSDDERFPELIKKRTFTKYQQNILALVPDETKYSRKDEALRFFSNGLVVEERCILFFKIAIFHKIVCNC